MKNLFIFIISICSISGCSEKKSERILINKFINEIKLNKEFNFLDSKKYINYKSMNLKKEEVVSLLINENIKLLRKNLSKNDSIKIFTHNELIKNQVNFSFNYKYYSKVYYIIGDNKNVITTIIVDSRKVIAFSYNIIKNINKPKTPLLLNEI
jgi:hypothetical protein